MANEYKDPNTDIMKALSKAVDAATGETGTQYEYKNPNTDVIQKLEELIEAITTSGGGGGGHNYSTTEQVIGTWIDGSTLYEKTIVYSGNIRHGTYTTIDNSLLYSGVGFFTVVNASAKLSNINTWYTYCVGGKNYDVALSDAIGVYVENYSDKYDISDVVVTVRYTKSST